ncbi:MAG: hypothetical protein LBB56_06970, partial [Chitinispirillales bacterium]|nr:hypothetical protein [Chitinispirillales bacterium]
MTLDELRTIDNNLFMRIPNKFLFGFAFHLIRSITRFAKEMDQVEFIKRTLACCKYVRDHISERLAIDLFDMSKMYIDDFQLNSQDAVCIYHSFIVHMAENKIRVGEYNLALLMYHQYLNQLPSFSSIGLSDNW